MSDLDFDELMDWWTDEGLLLAISSPLISTWLAWLSETYHFSFAHLSTIYSYSLSPSLSLSFKLFFLSLSHSLSFILIPSFVLLFASYNSYRLFVYYLWSLSLSYTHKPSFCFSCSFFLSVSFFHCPFHFCTSFLCYNYVLPTLYFVFKPLSPFVT